VKRAVDLFGAGTGLLLLWPLVALAAAGILVRMGRPVFFRQIRLGYRERPFALIKLCTMVEAADAGGRPLPDGARLTRLGRLLRKTSIDELPTLVNVLKGDMSLVGPRPLLPEYLPRYGASQRRRHEVKPGITGWAQVNGRNTLSWEQKFDLDVWYVDNQSLWLDLKILAMTVWKTLRGEDINQAGHETMPEFTGTEKFTTKPRPRRDSGVQ
jgi:sugar transferase EpsL